MADWPPRLSQGGGRGRAGGLGPSARGDDPTQPVRTPTAGLT